MQSQEWTPLLAVVNSRRAPQPEKLTENTLEALDAAQAKLKAIDPKLIAQRDERRLKIVQLLIKAKAQLDLHDGKGATALYGAVSHSYEEVALLLIAAGAEMNTKTGVYIDGIGDFTPLHGAIDSPRVLKAMIDRGAKLNVRDAEGTTPLLWAVRLAKPEAVRLLLDGGADPSIANNQGDTPAKECQSYLGLSLPGDKERAEIAELLKRYAKPNK
jgi:ankyrin repeat protein